MLNTKTLSELEAAQNAAAQKFNLTLRKCIENGRVGLEDGLPWIEAEGKLDKSTAKQFAQELADTMNIRVLYNRLESWAGSDSCLHLVLDISPDAASLNEAIAAYSNDPEAAEFMEDYGKEIYPTGFKKVKKKM